MQNYCLCFLPMRFGVVLTTNSSYNIKHSGRQVIGSSSVVPFNSIKHICKGILQSLINSHYNNHWLTIKVQCYCFPCIYHKQHHCGETSSLALFICFIAYISRLPHAQLLLSLKIPIKSALCAGIIIKGQPLFNVLRACVSLRANQAVTVFECTQVTI